MKLSSGKCISALNTITLLFLSLGCGNSRWQANKLAAAEAERLEERIGFYHWGGVRSISINQGIEKIADIGGKIARITLSARYRQDYYKDAAGCLHGFSLGAALRNDPDLSAALGNPKIEVLMLTVLDGTSYGDCTSPHALNPRFYTSANREAMEQEYSDFVFLLHQNFAGSGKKFILSNWEGDNHIYCGSAHMYAHHQDFRDHCNAKYPEIYLGNSNPAESFQGMKLWMRARSFGIAAGKRRGLEAGLPPLDVLLAPEIVSVKLLHDLGYASVLYDVIPYVDHDFVSYSAYESLIDDEPGKRLTQDLDTISRVTNGSKIIIGESGFARSVWGDQVLPRTIEVHEAALKWGVAYLIHWNLFDQEIDDGFGLFDAAGKMNDLGIHFQRVFTQ